MASFKLFGMKRLVAWYVDKTDATGTAVSTASGTALSLATNQGSGYTDATAAQPHRILIDAELMYVTAASGDNLTVVRARDGTTGATHLISAPVAHLHPCRLWKASAFTMDAAIQTIEFPGDGDVEQVFQSQSISGTFTLSKFVTDLLEKVAGSAAATTGLHTNETRRWTPEMGTYPYVELNADRRAVNDDTGADEVIRTYVWKTKLQKPYITGDAGNNAAEISTFNWSSTATTTDLFNLPIQGPGNVPVNTDIHWSYAEVPTGALP
jgi:hypothetical protein